MAKPPVLRTKSATTKVTEAEYARLESLAEASGVNMSEWMRGRLLGRDEDTATVLGEVLALRTILINLLFSVSNGKPVTPEAMKELIEKADGDKARRAVERLTAAVPKMEAPTEGAETEAGEAG
jgi:hypothetical protein